MFSDPGDSPTDDAPLEAAVGRLGHSWDAATDVVVVGQGCAGVSASIAAADAGAEVLVLERAGGPGGASALSGGIVYLGGGTALQRACGVDDSVDAMAAFLAAACGPGTDRARVIAYCEGSAEHFDWLVANGVEFAPVMHPQPNGKPETDAGLIFCGGEDGHPFAGAIPPAPRGHCPRIAGMGGGYLMGSLDASARQRAVQTVTDVRVRRLFVDGDGRVVGVLARRAGGDFSVRARRGVVLAGGGFGRNQAMVDRYCPVLNSPSASPLGTDYDDGAAIRMGEGAGGLTTQMAAIECALLPPFNRLSEALLVDGTGRRFVNEDAYPGRIGVLGLRDRAGQMLLVVDDALHSERFPTLAPDAVSAEVGELAAAVGLPVETLIATVAAYGEATHSGVDEQFGKRYSALRTLSTPLGIIDLRRRADVFATFTLGGLATDLEGRVLGLDGPIDGLFAAGRCAAGIPVGGYVSGISLGEGSLFGRRAGVAAARRI